MFCNECGESLVSDGFDYEYGSEKGYHKYYRCPQCNKEPEEILQEQGYTVKDIILELALQSDDLGYLLEFMGIKLSQQSLSTLQDIIIRKLSTELR